MHAQTIIPPLAPVAASFRSIGPPATVATLPSFQPPHRLRFGGLLSGRRTTLTNSKRLKFGLRWKN